MCTCGVRARCQKTQEPNLCRSRTFISRPPICFRPPNAARMDQNYWCFAFHGSSCLYACRLCLAGLIMFVQVHVLHHVYTSVRSTSCLYKCTFRLTWIKLCTRIRLHSFVLLVSSIVYKCTFYIMFIQVYVLPYSNNHVYTCVCTLCLPGLIIHLRAHHDDKLDMLADVALYLPPPYREDQLGQGA